jgi:Protein of unknown function (DUF1552)
MKTSSGFTRRAFIRGASGAALALPLLNDVPRAFAQAATAPPKRLIVVFSPNGTIPSAWASTGSGATFKPGTIQQPFVAAGHQNDLVIVHGLDNLPTTDGAGGDAHGLGIGCLLTGIELQQGSQFLAGCGVVGQFCGSSGWPNGMSVDQFIASRVGKTTQFPSLDFAVKRMSGSLWSRMSYSDVNVPVTPMDDPGVAFDRIFANVGTSASALQLQSARRKSVLDAISPRFTALASKLSAGDRDKVNTHLAALRDIESRLGTMEPMTGTSGSECVKPARPALSASAEVMYNSSGMEVENSANDVDVPMRNQLIRDLLVPALACDLSRVATMMLAPSRSDIFFNFIGINSSHHDLSHDPDSNTASQMKLIQINTWYATQVAALVTSLKGVPEGGGTMFDNTIVFWCNELGIGNNHSHTKMPLLIAAGKNTGFKTGQAVTMPDATPHNRLLLNLIDGMGITGVTSFGNPKFCSAGPLQEIMA